MKRGIFNMILTLAVLCWCQVAWSQTNESRLWKDSTGKFQINAKLVEQKGANVLLLTTDGREISVPVERLSETDQQYLKALSAPKDNPFAGGKPAAKKEPSTNGSPVAPPPGSLRALPESASAGTEMALPATGTALQLDAERAAELFVPDPLPNVPILPVGQVAVSPVDPYDKVSSTVLASAAEGQFLASIGRNKSGSPQETRGRIYSVSLTKKKVDLVWDFPQSVRVWDHDEASGRTLIVDKLDQFQRGGEIVMVEGLAAGAVNQLYRRTLPGAGKPGFAPQVEWARLVSGSHAVVIVDGTLYVWDLPAAKLLYLASGVSAKEPPAFSGNQLYMAIPLAGKAVIVETATGKVRSTIPTGSTLKPGVAFDPTGRLLALSQSNQYRVWDCVAETVVSEATTTEHLGSHPLFWLGDSLIRTQLGDTVHLGLGMSVWKYSLPPASEPTVIGNRMLVTTGFPNCTLISVEAPHAAAEKSITRLMNAGDAAMLVRPGSEVAIAVEGAEAADQSAIVASLTEAAEKAGWKIGNNAPITLVAKIGRGKSETLRFRNLRGGPGESSSAELTPFTAELQIRRGTNVLWQRATVNRIPPILHLKEGETVQDAVKRYEKPDAAFFATLNLPPRIPRPEITQQVGRSTLNNGAWQDLK